MRIYLISPNPIWGGAASANMAIAQMLSDDHEVLYNDEYNKLDIDNVIYDSFPIHKLKDPEALYHYIIEKKVDMVIWGIAMIIPYYKSLTKKLQASNIKQCVLFHSLSISRNIRGRLMELMISRSLNDIDHLVFVSEYTDNSWSKYKTIQKHPNHHVIYNPINIEQTRINADHNRIGFVGRFSDEKQPEVFAKISEIDDIDKYIAWGEGESLSELKSKYSKVEFKGHSSNQNEIYESFDILVMTSVFENCPMVILEAWKYGIPCVVPNVGGIPEIVKNNYTGILYDGYDVKDILSAIKIIKKNYAFYSQNCSQSVLNYSFGSIKDKWNKIINHQ